MTTEDFISELFYRRDEPLKSLPQHPLASLWPSEVVMTWGVLFARKGVGPRACSRWVRRDGCQWFPALPERPRLFGDPAHVEGGVSGPSRGVGRWGQLWHGIAPSPASRAQVQTNGTQREIQPSLDWRRKILPAAQPLRVSRRLGLCRGHCPGLGLPSTE
jgi:hypothetical protein